VCANGAASDNSEAARIRQPADRDSTGQQECVGGGGAGGGGVGGGSHSGGEGGKRRFDVGLFDTVLMNPPFGTRCKVLLSY
jgi:hypothetical protein